MSDGRIRVDGHLTRPGVFEYRNPDGSIRREYRPPEEVFDPKSTESYAHIPVTNGHPQSLLTTKNAREYAVGAVGENIRKDGEWIAAPFVVYDDKTITDMELGKVALSVGYSIREDHTPGVAPCGTPYHLVQRDIRANHLAIVDIARAGQGAHARMDGISTLIAASAASVTNHQENVMDLAQALTALAAANEKIGTEKSRADAAEAKVRDLTKRADQAEGDRDTLKSRLEKVEAERKDAADNLPIKIRERVTLETQAAPFLEKDTDVSKLTDRGIREAVIKRLDNADMAGKSDDYVTARYDRAIEVAGTEVEVLGKAREAATGSLREDAKPDARAEMIRDQQNAWKTKKTA